MADPIRNFLHARLDEVEHGASRAGAEQWHYGGIESVGGGSIYDATRMVASVVWDNERPRINMRYQPPFRADAVGEHIVRLDPDWALRMSRFLRVTLMGHQAVTAIGETTWTPHKVYCTCNPYKEWPCIVLRQLATVWSDHENFDESWRV